MLIDTVKAVELLNEAVADKGADYIYESPDLMVMDKEAADTYRRDGSHVTRVNGYDAWAMRDADAGSCYYVHTDGKELYPGCLVGHALHKAGVPLTSMVKNENASDMCDLINQDVPLGIEITEDARNLFNRAQAMQDGLNGIARKPWGEAVATAMDMEVSA